MTVIPRDKGSLGEQRINEKIKEKVQTMIAEMEAESDFFKAAPARTLPNFDSEDVRIGELLGQGEFGDVFDIDSFLPDFGPCDCTRCLDQSSHTQRSEHDQEPIRPENDDHSESTEVSQELHERKDSKVDFAAFASILDWRNTTIYVPTAPGNHATGFVNNELKTPSEEDSIPPDALVDKAYMKKHCIRKELSRFAVKRVRSDIQKGKYKFGAALDLAREAMFLAHLSHPNIIKIRGTIGESGTPEFCLILDRMVTTLDKSILEWKRDVKNRRLNWNVAKRWGESRALEVKRLVVMYDISRAMKYLHKNGIIYRDLKPYNIGFDCRGTMKLFDLGLAKELHGKATDEAFEMTGLAGSRRYMAPEVVLCNDYDFSADVYSFGIVFWEVAALSPPFKSYSADRHFREVVVKGKRPATCPVAWLSPSMRMLMLECWRQDSNKRPTFSQVRARLQYEIVDRNCGSLVKDRSNDLQNSSWNSRYGPTIASNE